MENVFEVESSSVIEKQIIIRKTGMIKWIGSVSLRVRIGSIIQQHNFKMVVT
ncbi:MAG: hypothetical protein VCF25_09695 [Candidatus Poribacteria bacterium]